MRTLSNKLWYQMCQICTGQEHQEFKKMIEFLSNQPEDMNILEIGVDYGGTLHAWRSITTGLVIGVDDESYGCRCGNIPGAHRVIGNSHDQSTLDKVKAILGDRQLDFIFIDGDHGYAGVKQDFDMYSPLLRVGGVIGFHDVVHTINECGVGRVFASLPEPKQIFFTPGTHSDRGIGVWVKT